MTPVDLLNTVNLLKASKDSTIGENERGILLSCAITAVQLCKIYQVEDVSLLIAQGKMGSAIH